MMKRSKKKLPPLEVTCAFCRSPIHENESELISRHEKRVNKGDTGAMIRLAGWYMKGKHGLRKNDEKAIKLFQMAADLGSAEAIGQLGNLAIDGQFPSVPTKAKECIENAAVKGHVLSRACLAALFMREGSSDLAIKHFQLAAAAGNNDSIKFLWKYFYSGQLSKPDLEKALRAHKVATDEMNSEERERYDAYNEAKAGNDEFLKAIYDMYYLGHINAKELEVALKAHRSKDWGEVGTQLKIKIQSYIHAHTKNVRYIDT
jgi:TPR repeat protein